MKKHYKENQPKHHMLIFRGIHVFSQFVRRLPKRRLDGFLFVTLTDCFPDEGIISPSKISVSTLTEDERVFLKARNIFSFYPHNTEFTGRRVPFPADPVERLVMYCRSLTENVSFPYLQASPKFRLSCLTISIPVFLCRV